MTGRKSGPLALGLAIGAVLAMAAPAYPAYGGPAAAEGKPGAAARAAAPLPGGLGPCVPGDCPPVWPEPNNMPPTGTDNAINVYAGGDFLVREGAAEAEGRVVVLGDFDMNRTRGGSVYNIGIVGVGSQVQPPLGSDFLTTGGDVSVTTGQRLLADGGVVRYAGTLTGTVTGTTTQDDDAADPYTALRAQLTSASKCYARVDGSPRTPTGTVTNLSYETQFVGDGTSMLQVFNVTGDLASTTGGAQSLSFSGIPAGATVLVNVFGADPVVNINSGVLAGLAKEKLLWNFPDAEEVSLFGSGQFQGSTLIAEPDSMATVQLPGVNGRFFTAGSITHSSSATGGGGQEFHSYPFTGDLPECNSVPVTGSVSVLKVDSESGAALAGAGFELWKESNGTEGLQTGGATPDTKVEDCTTGADGKCASTVGTGTYYWRETSAPAGHDLPENPVFGPLVLTPENASQGVTVRAENEPTEEPTGTVSVLKVDSETGAVLPGAVFELWKESNGQAGLQTTGTADTKVEECTTPADGSCEATGTAGSYYWRETSAPDGYELPADPVFGPLVLDPANGRPTATVTARNRKTAPVTGAVSVLKVDSESGDALAGAVFELWKETNGVAGLQTTGAAPDTKVEDCTTPANGICASTVEPGGYYWRETAAPAGHELPENPVFGPLVLTAENASQGVRVRAENEPTVVPPVTGTVRVIKTDSETGDPLPGATFSLWRETNGTPGLQTAGPGADTLVSAGCVTSATGQCGATVAPGSYYWQETAVPAGYDLPANPVSGPLVLTEENASQGVTVTAANRKTPEPPYTGGIKVEKKDGKSGRALRGAVFELWKETNGIRGLQQRGINPDVKARPGCATDREGVCAFDDLTEGSYYLVETAVPEGYVMPRNPVTGPIVISRTNEDYYVTSYLNNQRGEGGKGKGDGNGSPSKPTKPKLPAQPQDRPRA
ncbi:SpaA isopeptide-forming pilin-related protein [Streptomyces sp. NPDC097619]|uniref:SpaA isopeptide-forming pilin-related protein n=1 Tax=Streptomyces sp. NPDC097619 TaxID=3157228 RepID=UPI00331ADD6B